MDLLKKLMGYLDITSKEYLQDLEKQKNALSGRAAIEQIEKFAKEHKDHIDHLKQKLHEGHCFAFALCHGAMDLAGKLEWWEHALLKLSHWDGTPGGLNCAVALPHTGYPQKEILLKELFNRALNYIVFHQLSDSRHDGFRLTGVYQINLLRPHAHVIHDSNGRSLKKQSYFEFLDDGAIKTIKHRKVMAGSFTKDDLEKLLDEGMLRDTICLVRSFSHAIRIGYNGKTWIVYDSLYDHANLNTIHKKLNKEQMIEEVFARLKTRAINFEVVSFNKKLEFPYYEKLLDSSPQLLQDENVLMVFILQAPYYFSHIVKRIERFKQGPAIQAAIATYLRKTDYDGWTGLQKIASLASQVMVELCRLAARQEGMVIRFALADALPVKNPDGANGLHIIMDYSSKALVAAIHIALNGMGRRTGLDFVINTMNIKGHDNLTKWQHMEPEQKKAILALLFNHLERLDQKSLQAFKAAHSYSTYQRLSLFFKGGVEERNNLDQVLLKKARSLLQNKPPIACCGKPMA